MNPVKVYKSREREISYIIVLNELHKKGDSIYRVIQDKRNNLI